MISVNLQNQRILDTNRLNVQRTCRSEVQAIAQDITGREFFEVRYLDYTH